MKPVQIDFVPDARWRLLWLVSALCLLGLAGIWGWNAWQHSVALARLDEHIGNAEQKLRDLRAPTIAANPRLASARQAAQLLQLDLHKAFATVENTREPGIRLRDFQLNPANDILRLEYELDSMAKASVITSLLNSGYLTSPWELEGVITTGSSIQANFTPATQTVRASWTTRLDKL